jgi:hypothetical protein
VVKRIIKRDVARAKGLQVGFLALDKKRRFGAYAIHKGFTFSVKAPAWTKCLKPEVISNKKGKINHEDSESQSNTTHSL